MKGRKETPIEYKKLIMLVNDYSNKLTMKRINPIIDIDNFTRWWISHIVCANSDPYQGIALLNKKEKHAKWFWINWDMDHSFKNIYEKKRKLWEQERPFSHVMLNTEKKKDPRDILFRRLHHEDPEYKKYFEKMMMKTLNHIVTHDYIKTIMEYYKKQADILKMNIKQGQQEFETYFKKRPAYIRYMMKKYYHSGDSYCCKIKNATRSQLYIDGYLYNKDYKGWYFKKSKININIKSWNKNCKYSYLVNGIKTVIRQKDFSIEIDSDKTVAKIKEK